MKNIFFVFLIIICVQQSVFCTIYDWREGNTEVIMVDDPYVDAALMLHLIGKVKYTIRSVTYIQDVDEEVGLPLLEAFRGALAKGANGHFIYQRIGAITNDPLNRSKDFLIDSNLKCPGKVFCHGKLDEVLEGENPTDMVHAKIIEMDRGTLDEIIRVSGRNPNRFLLKDYDYTIYIRPIDPNKPYLGNDVQKAYDHIEKMVAEREEAYENKKIDPEKLEFSKKVRKPTDILKTKKQKKQFKKYLYILGKGLDYKSRYSHLLSYPTRSRVVTNDFFKNLKKVWAFSTLGTREKVFSSDIINVVSDFVLRNKEVYLTPMSINFPKSLQNAISESLKNKNTINIITNGKEAHQNHVVAGLPFYHGMDNLKQFAQKYPDYLKVFLFQPNKKFIYSHRKMVIGDNEWMMGSDNLNLSGVLKNYEIMLHFEDPEGSQRMRRTTNSDIKRMFIPSSCSNVLTQAKSFGWFKSELTQNICYRG